MHIGLILSSGGSLMIAYFFITDKRDMDISSDDEQSYLTPGGTRKAFPPSVIGQQYKTSQPYEYTSSDSDIDGKKGSKKSTIRTPSRKVSSKRAQRSKSKTQDYREDPRQFSEDSGKISHELGVNYPSSSSPSSPQLQPMEKISPRKEFSPEVKLQSIANSPRAAETVLKSSAPLPLSPPRVTEIVELGEDDAPFIQRPGKETSSPRRSLIVDEQRDVEEQRDVGERPQHRHGRTQEPRQQTSPKDRRASTTATPKSRNFERQKSAPSEFEKEKSILSNVPGILCSWEAVSILHYHLLLLTISQIASVWCPIYSYIIHFKL